MGGIEPYYLPGAGRAAISWLIGGGRFIGRARSEWRRDATGDQFEFDFIELFHSGYLLRYVFVDKQGVFCYHNPA